jgi:hypothetical protein
MTTIKQFIAKVELYRKLQYEHSRETYPSVKARLASEIKALGMTIDIELKNMKTEQLKLF